MIKLKETIDEKGNMKVTDGLLVPSEPSKPRQGAKKTDCIYPQAPTVSWWRASL